MTVLLVLIMCYLIIVMMGQHTGKLNYLGYLFVAIITVLQLAFMLYYMFTMEVPTP